MFLQCFSEILQNFHRNMSSPQVTGATKHSSIFHQSLTEKDGHTFSFKVNAEYVVAAMVAAMVGGSCNIMKFNKTIWKSNK